MIAVWWYYLVSGFMIEMIIWLLFKNTALEDRYETQKLVSKKWVAKHAATVREARRWKTQAVDYEADFMTTVVRWKEEKYRAYIADMRSVQVVQAVLPLVEKTDWMTGRWAGQFAELQALEKQRNEVVAKVQQVIGTLPAAEGLDKMEILRSGVYEATVRLQDDAGVPEGEYLHFSAEGGVQRRSRPTEGVSWDEATDFEVSPTIDNRQKSVWIQDTLPGMEDLK